MKIIYNIPNIIRMAGMERILAIKANSVSYTHLTLPTKQVV